MGTKGKGIYRIAPFAHIEGEWKGKELLGGGGKQNIWEGRNEQLYEQEKE